MMGSRRLFWKLFIGNALLMAVVLAVFVWLIAAVFGFSLLYGLSELLDRLSRNV